jgi:two-component SAPR family response regulator
MISRSNDQLQAANPRASIDRGAEPASQPILIHTLGRFGIQIDGQALAPKQLRQQKPIEMLQCLIAQGGRGINKEFLSNAVWPEAEGDDAVNSFDVTLHRLRKILKHKDALLAIDSRLTINSETVWVDAWTFERLLNHVEKSMRLSESETIESTVINVLDQAMTLYQGGFLIHESLRPWGLSMQERLRSKLMRCIVQVGAQAETIGQWEVATHCYQTGMEIDPLYELFYQRLMICYRETHRKPEALAVYQRCRANLSMGLCIAPSLSTEKILTSL